MFAFWTEIMGIKYCGCGSCSSKGSLGLCQRLVVHKRFIRWLALPYAAGGSLRQENLSGSGALARHVLFNMYRTGALSKKLRDLCSNFWLIKDFMAQMASKEKTPTHDTSTSSHGRSKRGHVWLLDQADNVASKTRKIMKPSRNARISDRVARRWLHHSNHD